ncbi:MAG: TerB family tellurite resistance protein [bacterium]
MVFFGRQGVTSTTNCGEFCCPRCGQGKLYMLKRVRRFFTLFFMPLIPLEHLGDFVECQHCQGTFSPEVLDLDPERQQAELKAEYEKAILRVMVGIMLADDRVDDQEVTAIQTLYQEFVGRDLGEADVLEEIAITEATREPIPARVATFTHLLNDYGKEMVIKAALTVAAADGVFQAEEQRLVQQVAQALDMTPAHFQGVLAGFLKRQGER